MAGANLKPGDIEVEFGIPIPGVILPPEQWARTAIKRLPAEGPIDWKTVFGREAPLVLELGCGNGRFILSSAVLRPDHDHVGIDTLPVVIRYATRRGNQRGLANTRFAVCGAHEFLANYVSSQSVSEIHIYHPQPFHASSESHRRLFAPAFLRLLHRSLRPDGSLFVQTDDAAYWTYLRRTLPCIFEFHEEPDQWPQPPQWRSRREIMARSKGLKVFRGWGTPRHDLSDEEIVAGTEALPPPTFETERGRATRFQKRRRSTSKNRRNGPGPAA